MTATPSHAMLGELGEDLGWPSVTIGRLTILGVAAWGAALAVATPSERRAWLQALAEPLLVATPSSRARMQAWRMRSSWIAPSTPAWIHEHLIFYGDAAMLDPVVAAFAYMPEPVRDYVLREVAFRAVGADTYAWIGATSIVDRDGIGRPWTIMLSGADRHRADLVHAVLHEAAHAWTMPTPSALITVQGEHGLRAYLAEEGLTEQVDKRVAFEERLARALATVWVAAAP